MSDLAHSYTTYRRRLIALAVSLGCDRWTAEDLVQETFLGLGARPGSFAYLCRRLRWRIAKARRRALESRRGRGALHLPLCAAADVHDRSARPDQVLHELELRAALAALGVDQEQLQPGRALSGAERVARHRLRHRIMPILQAFL